MAITAHFVNEHFELMSVLLRYIGMKWQHSIENMAHFLSQIVSERKVDHKII
jgi:hypothetical protein